MIRKKPNTRMAFARLADERNRLAEQRVRRKTGWTWRRRDQALIDPMESFHLPLKAEVESYERLKRGEFEELENFALWDTPPL